MCACEHSPFGTSYLPLSCFGLRFRVPSIELKNPSSPEIRKKLRNSPPRVGPRKIRKKYRKNTTTVIFEPFSYFFCIFFGFSGARPGVGSFVTFSYFFRISGLEGFLSSIPGTRNRKFWELVQEKVTDTDTDL